MGSNCCAFTPAKPQPSLMDGSAAGIFHRAEVGGCTCSPFSDVSCVWLARSRHALPTRREVCNFLPSTWFRGAVANRSTFGRDRFPVNARLFPSSSVPKFRSRKRDTSFRGYLGTFQLRRDSAKVASRFVTVDSTSSSFRPQRVGPVCQLFNPAPKSGNVGLRVWAKGPVSFWWLTAEGMNGSL
jgi:hypothetical protein